MPPEHNYGDIQKGGNGECEFTFVNEGNEPLILSNVKASCGCTTPSYTQKPVMPGKTGTIKVHYNTNNVGGFSKTVTVESNAVDNPRVVLKIKGTVHDPNTQQQTRPSTAPAPAKPAVKPAVKVAKPAAKTATKVAKPAAKAAKTAAKPAAKTAKPVAKAAKPAAKPAAKKAAMPTVKATKATTAKKK